MVSDGDRDQWFENMLRPLEKLVSGILQCRMSAKIVAQIFAGLLKVTSPQLLMTILEMSEKQWHSRLEWGYEKDNADSKTRNELAFCTRSLTASLCDTQIVS